MKECLEKGPTEIRTKLSIAQKRRHKTNLINKNVLKKISQEAVKLLDRDPDEFIDLVKMAEDHPEYLQHVHRIPFAAISLYEEIYRMLRKPKLFSPVFYLDGTGSAVGFSKAKQKIQIYVLLGYNYITDQSIPITTFLTESHGTTDFHNWFNIFRATFESSGTKTVLDVIKIVNVDWTWAFVGALIRANNNQRTVPDYIQRCYDLLLDPKGKLDFMAIHFCFNHFMKTFARDLKKMKTPVLIKRKFMKCMRLAVAMKKLEDIKKWFRLVVIFFSSHLRTELHEKVNSELKSKISKYEKGVEVTDEDEIEELEEYEIERMEEIEKSYIEDPPTQSSKKRIFLDSPFLEVFQEVFDDAMIEIETQKSNPSINYSSNSYFFPKFLTKLMEKYLAIVCLWSNIITSRVDPKRDVYSNARIEQFFRLLKHTILQCKMKQRLSRFFRKLWAYVLSIENQSGMSLEDVFATEGALERAEARKRVRIDKNNPNLLDQCVDEWKRPPAKRRKLDNHLFQKNHGKIEKLSSEKLENIDHHIEDSTNNEDTVAHNEDSTNNEDMVAHNTVNISKPVQERVIYRKKICKYALRKVRKIVVSHDDWLERFNFNFELLPAKLKFINFNITFPTYQNRWFLGDNPQLHVFGSFIQGVTSDLLQCLQPKKYLSDVALETIISVYLKNIQGHNAVLIPCNVVSCIFDPKIFMHTFDPSNLHCWQANILNQTHGTWICPLNISVGVEPWKSSRRKNHWVLFIVDFQQKEVFYFDPLKKRYQNIELLKATFLERMAKILGFSNLPFDSVGWRERSSEIDQDVQKDAYNCGMFVAKYAESYLKKENFKNLGDMDVERTYVSYMLLSEMTTETCFYCSRAVTTSDIHCPTCEKKCCDNCGHNKFYKFIKEQNICELCAWNAHNNL